MSEQEALAILNGFKADLSRMGHAVANAIQDGKIDAGESVGLILQGTQIGGGYYYQFARLKDNLGTFLEVLDRASFSLEG